MLYGFRAEFVAIYTLMLKYKCVSTTGMAMLSWPEFDVE